MAPCCDPQSVIVHISRDKEERFFFMQRWEQVQVENIDLMVRSNIKTALSSIQYGYFSAVSAVDWKTRKMEIAIYKLSGCDFNGILFSNNILGCLVWLKFRA